jgi:NAD+ kinase
VIASQPIGLVAHAGKPRAGELVRLLATQFRTRGAVLLFDPPTAALAGELGGLPISDLGRRCSIVVVLGGDGTLLRTVHQLGEAICPLFGINLGSLGFLTCVNSSASDEAVEAICAGEFILSKRTLLSAEVERGGGIVCRYTGLNDAVISRGPLSRLIKLDTAIDGIDLTQYNADGLIVATPTGSTAYSISAGGPVILPQTGAFVITPICPHVLTNRSVVVGDQSEITVRPVRGQRGITLSVDGQETFRVRAGDLIRIRKSRIQLPLAMLPNLSFSEVLRQKLKWSGSAV